MLVSPAKWDLLSGGGVVGHTHQIQKSFKFRSWCDLHPFFLLTLMLLHSAHEKKKKKKRRWNRYPRVVHQGGNHLRNSRGERKALGFLCSSSGSSSSFGWLIHFRVVWKRLEAPSQLWLQVEESSRLQDAESPFAPNGCSAGVLMLMSTELSRAGQIRSGIK